MYQVIADIYEVKTRMLDDPKDTLILEEGTSSDAGIVSRSGKNITKT